MSATQPGAIARETGEEIFVGDSEMGALMRSHDWSQTPLGPLEQWSQSLKVAVNICLNSRFPMVIWWGEALTLLYNDAWRPILGNKHPQALGKPGQDVWSEIWDIVGTQLRSVLNAGKATWSDDQLLLVNRYGYTEEAYFTYSYSPIFLETGEVGGAFTAVAETTQRVVGERRLATLRDLAAQTGQSQTIEQACHKAIQTLSENSSDIPLALLYLLNSQGTQATLQAQTPAQIQPLIAPAELDLTQPGDPLTQAVALAVQSNQHSVLENLVQHWGEFPVGPVYIPLQQAIVLPIRVSTQDSMVQVLVLAVNPYQALDDEQRQFLEMTTGHIANAIASARAYEEERKRAEALAELDRAKTAFFSNVSHEFRTPLTLMLGPLEEMLATEGVIPPQQHQQLELIHRNSLRLLKLVNTLLDFSRLEAGRVQAVYEPTDLAALTAELASVFRSAIEQAGLQFIVTCEPLTQAVYVDHQMWEKIVLNLLSNAFKFTFSGEIAVTLRPLYNQTELVVRDTGIGIPSTELPRLFERFHRVEGARGRTQEGSGIGLALVQELVRLHGGQVQVASIEGEGTTFTVTIPTGMAHLPSDRIQATRTLASTALGAAPYVEEALRWLPEEESRGRTGVGGEEKQGENRSRGREELIGVNSLASLASPAPPAPSAPSAPPTPPASSPSPARIVLVDDNSDMRNYVKRLLLSQGYEVATAADGRAALAMIEQQIPDLVLTDVMMPQLDGFGLLRELRTVPTTREIPIIMLSARAGEEARIEGLEAGADDYLTKPFSARELLARVEATLKLAQLRREATQREQALRLEAETAHQNVETVLSSINDGFLVLDRNWCYTYINDRNCEIIGMQRSEVLGRNIWELFPDVVGTQVYVQFQRAMTEQTAAQFEYFYSTWNRWFEYRVYPSVDALTVFVADITERRQGEAALKQSQARFRLMAETIPDVFWMTDFGTPQILYVSPAYEPIWGQSPEAIYQDYTVWAQTIHPDDRERALAIAATCQYEDVVEQDYRIVRPDGTIRWIRDRGFAVRDDTGQIQQVVGIAQDITDEKLALEALKQSEAKFRRLVEVSMFGVAIGDFSGNIFYANDSLLNTIGYSREELEAGQISWLDLTPPEQVHLDGEACKELRQRGICKAFEKEYIHKNGHRVPILIGGALLDEPYAQQELIITFYLDLTELKQTGAELQEGKRILDALMEYIPEGITIADAPDVTIQRVSRYGQQLMGKSREMLENIPVWEHPEHWEIFHLDGITLATSDELPLTRATQQGEVVTNEEWLLQRSDGTQIYISCNAGPIEDQNGHITGGVMAWRDVTALKQTQAERERLLQQAQAAREDAETANRIKDEFLAVLSHELRSPLNPILGWSRLLQTRQFDAQRTKLALQTIERNAKLQTQLIEDLLDVSRILRGKMALNVCPVNLIAVVESALETVQLAADAKHIQIQTVISLKNPKVSGDAARLQQIVWNLVSNAVKFTPDRGRVEVCLDQIDTYAQIQVKDTGKGISPDFLPYVFDYFRQEDGKTTRKFGGLGLGLAIVRHLTELHGGTVDAESPGEGQGATFMVKLPLLTNAAQSGEERSTSAQAVDLSQLRILVVDDEEDMRELVQVILEQQGAQVMVAATAAQALRVFDRQPPDILLSDIGMPEIDGYMLMRQIRGRSPEQGGLVAAIALTAYAGEYDQQQALQAGFQQHIAKPVEPEALVKAIADLVTNR